MAKRLGPVRHLAITLILLFPIAFANLSYAAGRVFFEDFESYSVGTLPTTKWEKDGTRNLPQVVTSSIDGRFGPHGGSKMMRANWNGTVIFNDPAAYETARLSSWNYNREFLIRLWLRYDADVDLVFGNKVFRLYPGNSIDSFYYAAAMNTNQQLVTYWELIDSVAGPQTFWPQIVGNGNWHKIEIYVLHNTPGNLDGILRIWVDGFMGLNSTNRKTISNGGRWYPMYLMSNWSGAPHDANNHAYWDDIEIFSDTGSGAAGLMSDATICAGSGCALPSPANLRLLP